MSGNSYSYNCNGNQINRVIDSDTFNLLYDAENRLVEVKKNSTTITQFTYDGDGKRVKSVMGGDTTLFVGTHYEVTGTEATKYKAWGEVRYSSGTNPTDYTYTGQYSYTDDFGLMFYNAYWYDPSLGRFAQADTIVPSGVQGLDRYAYVNNSPLNYTDPSGHCSKKAEDYDECMEWAKKIEKKWDFARVEMCQTGTSFNTSCKGWTTYELELLYETLDEYVLGDQIDDGIIYFMRTNTDEYNGLHEGYLNTADGSKFSVIHITDGAWTSEPGKRDLINFGIKEDNNFKGVIAHELTHAAIWFNPELIDKYRDTIDTLDPISAFLATNVIGWTYNFSVYDEYKSDPVQHALLVDGEMLAMSVASSMYDDWYGTYR